MTYTALCMEAGEDSKMGLNRLIYRKAMELSLLNSALEDLNEHGRLLVLKDHLLSLVDRSERLSIKTLGLFQMKDFCALDE